MRGVDTAGLDRAEVARLRDKQAKYAAAVLRGEPLDEGHTLDGVYDLLVRYHREVRQMDDDATLSYLLGAGGTIYSDLILPSGRRITPDDLDALAAEQPQEQR